MLVKAVKCKLCTVEKHHLVEIPPSKLIFAKAKVIAILPVRPLELSKISIKHEMKEGCFGHLKAREYINYLASSSQTSKSTLANALLSINRLEVGHTK